MDLMPNKNENMQNKIEGQIFFKIWLKNTFFNIMNMGCEQGFEKKKEGGALIRGEALIRDYTVYDCNV